MGNVKEKIASIEAIMQERKDSDVRYRAKAMADFEDLSEVVHEIRDIVNSGRTVATFGSHTMSGMGALVSVLAAVWIAMKHN